MVGVTHDKLLESLKKKWGYNDRIVALITDKVAKVIYPKGPPHWLVVSRFIRMHNAHFIEAFKNRTPITKGWMRGLSRERKRLVTLKK